MYNDRQGSKCSGCTYPRSRADKKDKIGIIIVKEEKGGRMKQGRDEPRKKQEDEEIREE